MVKYSITDLEGLTGIKAHTLRIWEKRYSIVEPHRTETNIRYYLEEDLKKLLNISLLNQNGYRISKIAEMTEAEIAEKTASLTHITHDEQNFVDILTISLIELDAFKFQSIFNHHIQEHGLEYTMFELIYPFLEKLSLLWVSGSIQRVHELFLNNIVRQKILVAIDEIQLRKRNGMLSFLLFIPGFCRHEVSLLFIHFLLLSRNFNTVYIGNRAKEEDILKAIDLTSPDYLFTITLNGEPEEWNAFMHEFYSHTNTPIILLGPSLAMESELKTQIRALASISQVLDYIEQLPVPENIH